MMDGDPVLVDEYAGTVNDATEGQAVVARSESINAHFLQTTACSLSRATSARHITAR